MPSNCGSTCAALLLLLLPLPFCLGRAFCHERRQTLCKQNLGSGFWCDSKWCVSNWKARRPWNWSNKKVSWPFLTNIHSCFHETLLPGCKFSKQFLLSLSGPLTPERKNEWNTTGQICSNVNNNPVFKILNSKTIWKMCVCNYNITVYWIRNNLNSTNKTVLKQLNKFYGSHLLS